MSIRSVVKLFLLVSYFGIVFSGAAHSQNAVDDRAKTIDVDAAQLHGHNPELATPNKSILRPDFRPTKPATITNVSVTSKQHGALLSNGATGIPVGGGFSIGMHHASSWPVQIVTPDKSGHVEVVSPNASNLSLEHHIWAPRGMLSRKNPPRNPDWIFHNVIIAKVTNQAVLPGEIVDVKFGANEQKLRVQRYVDPDHEFRVTTDIDGDGKYAGINSSPIIPVTHASGHSLSATAPSQVAKNESFSILIRMEDSNYNIVESYQGTVTLRDETGSIIANDILINNGMGSTQVTLSSIGPHRIRIESADGEFSGRSNPIRVFQNLPEKGLYWADLHGHTGVSDGLGKDADEYFKFGRDIAALDIIALTDHGYPDWPANIQAVKDYYEPGKYVTILAFEGGGPSSHANFYYRGDDTDHLSGWPSSYKDFLDAAIEQHNSNAAQPEAMAAPHHFTYEVGSNRELLYPFIGWNDKVARFIEVYSSHGTNEFIGNPRPLGAPSSDPSIYMQGGLARGLKFGVIGASDNHDSRPGRSIWGAYPNGLAAVWADSLTRDDVWDSLWNRETYATSIDRIYMEFRLNEHTMGSDIATTVPVNITGYIIGKTDVLEVTLIKNNQEIKSYATDNGLIEFSYEETPEPGEHFYYLRVSQNNGERAWSTPIWLDSTSPIPKIDDTPPVTTISNPSFAHEVLPVEHLLLEGTAADTGGSGLKKVAIAIYNSTTRNWVNTQGLPVNWLEIDATLIFEDADNANWFVPVSLPEGHYHIFSRGVDNNDNVQVNAAGHAVWQSTAFTTSATMAVDTIAPSATITKPEYTHEKFVSSDLQGKVSDSGGSGIDTVVLALYDGNNHRWIDSNGNAVTWQPLSPNLHKTTPHSADWSLPIDLSPGTYRVFLKATDAAGNSSITANGSSPWSSTPFVIIGD